MDFREIEKEDIEPLMAMAKEDEHPLYRPSHIIEKDGEMVGSVAMATIPMITLYVKKDADLTFGVRELERRITGMLKEAGYSDIAVVIDPGCGAFKMMPDLGYELTLAPLWLKTFDDDGRQEKDS